MAAAEIEIFFVHLNSEMVTESGRPHTTPNDDMNECVEWIQNTTSQLLDSSMPYLSLYPSKGLTSGIFSGELDAELDAFDVSFSRGCWHLTQTGSRSTRLILIKQLYRYVGFHWMSSGQCKQQR